MEIQKTSNNQRNLSKKNKSRSIIIPDFKLYYKTMAMKTGTKTEKTNGTEKKTRDQSSQLQQSFNFQQRSPNYTLEKR
jgi:hypothetical protein